MLSRKVIFFTMIFALAGCDDDDDAPTGTSGADTTAPGVWSVKAIESNRIELGFNEDVERESAENPSFYSIQTSDEPESTLSIVGVALDTDDRTVILTTEPMDAVTYEITVTGVQDLAGNGIETPVTRPFHGPDEADNTPPVIVYSTPSPNARDVLTTEPVEITFSEPISIATLVSGSSWSSDLGDVDFTVEPDPDSLHVSLVPSAELEGGTDYTIEITGVEDLFGNVMQTRTWSFRTVTTR